MKIVLQPEQSIDLDLIKISSVRDSFEEKKIIARVEGLPRPVILWSGEEEYAAAGNWTNDSILDRATEVLNSDSINWD